MAFLELMMTLPLLPVSLCLAFSLLLLNEEKKKKLSKLKKSLTETKPRTRLGTGGSFARLRAASFFLITSSWSNDTLSVHVPEATIQRADELIRAFQQVSRSQCQELPRKSSHTPLQLRASSPPTLHGVLKEEERS